MPELEVLDTAQRAQLDDRCGDATVLTRNRHDATAFGLKSVAAHVATGTD